jgi:hypothetical protein
LHPPGLRPGAPTSAPATHRHRLAGHHRKQPGAAMPRSQRRLVLAAVITAPNTALGQHEPEAPGPAARARRAAHSPRSSARKPPASTPVPATSGEEGRRPLVAAQVLQHSRACCAASRHSDSSDSTSQARPANSNSARPRRGQPCWRAATGEDAGGHERSRTRGRGRRGERVLHGVQAMPKASRRAAQNAGVPVSVRLSVTRGNARLGVLQAQPARAVLHLQRHARFARALQLVVPVAALFQRGGRGRRRAPPSPSTRATSACSAAAARARPRPWHRSCPCSWSSPLKSKSR